MLTTGRMSVDARCASSRQIINLLPLTACNATLLVDDIHDAPGRALRRAAAMGVVRVIEWHLYNESGSAHNPCVRRNGARQGVRDHSTTTASSNGENYPMLCLPQWGWAVAKYEGVC
jgi:hypothetical protein